MLLLEDNRVRSKGNIRDIVELHSSREKTSYKTTTPHTPSRANVSIRCGEASSLAVFVPNIELMYGNNALLRMIVPRQRKG